MLGNNRRILQNMINGQKDGRWVSGCINMS